MCLENKSRLSPLKLRGSLKIQGKLYATKEFAVYYISMTFMVEESKTNPS